MQNNKMTNLPQGWEVKKLGEISEIVTGSTPSKSNLDFYGKDYPFFKPSDFEQGYFLENAGDNLSKLGFDKARQLPPKTILVVCIGSLGKVALTRVIGSCNQQINAIIPHKNIIAEYIYYYCISSKFQSILFSKAPQTTLAILNKTEFSKLEIIYPKDIKEQERIVGILDESFAKIDESIKILEQDLLNLDELMQSTLQKAFNPLKDNTKENYQLPQGWEWKSLGEIANVKGGKRLPKGENLLDNNTKFAYIRVADFQDNGTINLQNIKFINENTYNILKNYKIYDDNLYISIAGTIGKSGIIPKELNGAILTENAVKLEYIQNNISNKFMYFFTLSNVFKTQIQTSTKIVAQPKLAITRLKQIQIPLPPLQEQEQIASHLDELSLNIKNLKQNYQAQIKDLQELKNSLLDKAFKGNL